MIGNGQIGFWFGTIFGIIIGYIIGFWKRSKK